MSNYPDGCTQADHDAYYDREEPRGHEDDTILADCGHYESEARCEVIGDKLLCPRCSYTPQLVPAAFETLQSSLRKVNAKVRIPERP